VTRPICKHPDCTTCREIVVGVLARELASVPEELRAGVCVEALRLAKAGPGADDTSPDAVLVAEMIG
jgi:hypothetical protein